MNSCMQHIWDPCGQSLINCDHNSRHASDQQWERSCSVPLKSFSKFYWSRISCQKTLTRCHRACQIDHVIGPIRGFSLDEEVSIWLNPAVRLVVYCSKLLPHETVQHVLAHICVEAGTQHWKVLKQSIDTRLTWRWQWRWQWSSWWRWDDDVGCYGYEEYGKMTIQSKATNWT